jgi:penicillin-binding protein 1C
MTPLMRRRASLALAGLAAAALALVAFRYWPRPALAGEIATSTAVFDRDGRLLRVTLAADGQYRLWTPLDRMPADLVDLLLLHEDRTFFVHPGVNPFALVRAASAALVGGAPQGASTITMQFARLHYGLHTRTVAGKLRQMACAVWLEMRYSKRAILEAHLNVMPYGGNVQGVGTASRVYFGKPVGRLALPEAMALVLIPQSPLRRSPHPVEPDTLHAARERLLRRWLLGHPDASRDPAAELPPLHFASRRELPFLAPHFTDYALALRPADRELRTTLDLPLQQLAERVVQQYVRDHSGVGIHNAAALLVDTRDVGVRAMVGSADFADAAIEGQVNGTLAKRSPGSALKPFIYALAIDQGLIHPLTVLRDVPTAFGPFSPENFDGRFVGPISATQALVRSRNIPAVALASRLSDPGFYSFLRSAGIAQLQPEKHYGLALVLGGGEVTMEELATLYAMLARAGRQAPLRHFADESIADGTPLLSAESSYAVLDMLRSAPRPDAAPAADTGRLHAAWKTGTSWGFRDAWTAGVFGHYVLVVWVGNFDGSGNPSFVGVQAAAPLFFRVMDAMQARDAGLVDEIGRPPARLTRVEVCTASGDLPNADCPQTSTTWYLPGVSPIRISNVHRRVWIDDRTGRPACPPYDPKHVHAEVFEYWPSELAQLFAQAGMPRRPPPDAPCQSGAPSGTPPQITSPLTGVTYTLRTRQSRAEHVPLVANTDSDTRRVYWFADNAYVGTSPPGTPLPWLPAHGGRYTLRAVDDRGRADERAVAIEMLP